MRKLEWQPDAWEEYVCLQQMDKTKMRKVNSLIKNIQRNGYHCTEGQPEMLNADLAGYASVRINQKDRLVFQVSDDTVTIISCGKHYSDH